MTGEDDDEGEHCRAGHVPPDHVESAGAAVTSCLAVVVAARLAPVEDASSRVYIAAAGGLTAPKQPRSLAFCKDTAARFRISGFGSCVARRWP
jgi:hypothetical protein